MTSTTVVGVPATASQRSRQLLTAGIVAAPLYVVVYLAQALTRDGFDMTRHPGSLLANGDFGWVQNRQLRRRRTAQHHGSGRSSWPAHGSR